MSIFKIDKNNEIGKIYKKYINNSTNSTNKIGKINFVNYFSSIINNIIELISIDFSIILIKWKMSKIIYYNMINNLFTVNDLIFIIEYTNMLFKVNIITQEQHLLLTKSLNEFKQLFNGVSTEYKIFKNDFVLNIKANMIKILDSMTFQNKTFENIYELLTSIIIFDDSFKENISLKESSYYKYNHLLYDNSILINIYLKCILFKKTHFNKSPFVDIFYDEKYIYSEYKSILENYKQYKYNKTTELSESHFEIIYNTIYAHIYNIYNIFIQSYKSSSPYYNNNENYTSIEIKCSTKIISQIAFILFSFMNEYVYYLYKYCENSILIPQTTAKLNISNIIQLFFITLENTTYPLSLDQKLYIIYILNSKSN